MKNCSPGRGSLIGSRMERFSVATIYPRSANNLQSIHLGSSLISSPPCALALESGGVAGAGAIERLVFTAFVAIAAFDVRVSRQPPHRGPLQRPQGLGGGGHLRAFLMIASISLRATNKLSQAMSMRARLATRAFGLTIHSNKS